MNRWWEYVLLELGLSVSSISIRDLSWDFYLLGVIGKLLTNNWFIPNKGLIILDRTRYTNLYYLKWDQWILKIMMKEKHNTSWSLVVSCLWISIGSLNPRHLDSMNTYTLSNSIYVYSADQRSRSLDLVGCSTKSVFVQVDLCRLAPSTCCEN